MSSILERFRTMPDKVLMEAQKELANSYRSIMGTLAWKHFTEEMDKVYSDSFKALDQCDIKEFSVALAAEGRGVRRAIETLKKKIENATRER